MWKNDDYEISSLQKEISSAKTNLDSLKRNLLLLEYYQKDCEDMLEEFSIIEDDALIYQRIGFVLANKTKSEVHENIKNRLKGINNEIESLTKTVNETEKLLKDRIIVLEKLMNI